MYQPARLPRPRTALLLAVGLFAVVRMSAAPVWILSEDQIKQSPRHAAALAQIRADDFTGALESARAILREHPDDAAAHLLVALAHVGRREDAFALDRIEQLASTNPAQVAAAYRHLGASYARTNRFHLARVCLERAARHGDDADVDYELGRLLVAQSRPAAARPLLEKALAAHPDHQTLGRVCLAVGDYAAARRHAETRLAQEAGDARALLLFGTSSLLLGRTDEAAATFDRLAGSGADAALTGHYAALTALVRGDHEAAASAATAALARQPRLREAQLVLALARLAQGRHEPAAKSAADVLAGHAGDALAQLVLAATQIARGQRGEAAQSLAAADAIIPEFAAPGGDPLRTAATWEADRAARFALANYLLSERLGGAALSVLGAASTDDPWCALVRARALAATGDPAAAEAGFTALANAQPRLFTPHFELAQRAFAAGADSAAVRHLEESARRAGDHPRFHLAAGGLAYRLHRADLAETHYRRAVALAPGSAVAHNQLAWSLGELSGRHAEALPLAEAARRLDPKSVTITDTLAWTLHRLGRSGEAARHYEPLLSHLPFDAAMLRRMSEVFAAAGRRTTAAELLERSLDLGSEPDSPEIVSRLQTLRTSPGQ